MDNLSDQPASTSNLSGGGDFVNTRSSFQSYHYEAESEQQADSDDIQIQIPNVVHQNDTINSYPESVHSNSSSSGTNITIVATPSNSEIATLLECPVCYDIMTNEILCCSKGHNICPECHSRVIRCPVCRDNYNTASVTPMRNRFAEQFASKCKILCKYKNSGCNVVQSGNQIRDHQIQCDFRPVTCPDCEDIIPYHQYIEHISQHDIGVVLSNEYSTGYEIHEYNYNTVVQKWELSWLSCHGCNFLCHHEKYGNLWCFWVSSADVNPQLKNYMCEIVLWNKEKGLELSYKGPVNPIRTTGEEAVRDGHGLVLTKEIIRAAVYHGGVDVVFRILKGSYHAPLLLQTNTEAIHNENSPPSDSETSAGVGTETINPTSSSANQTQTSQSQSQVYTHMNGNSGPDQDAAATVAQTFTPGTLARALPGNNSDHHQPPRQHTLRLAGEHPLHFRMTNGYGRGRGRGRSSWRRTTIS